MVISFYELYIFPINIIVIMGSVCIYIYISFYFCNSPLSGDLRITTPSACSSWWAPKRICSQRRRCGSRGALEAIVKQGIPDIDSL